MRITLKKICQKAVEWSNFHYRLLTVSTYHDYSMSHNGQYMTIQKECHMPVTPVKYVGEKQQEDVFGILPEQYFTILSGVSVIGASNVIIAGKFLLYDLLKKKKNNYNITDKGLFRVLNSPIHIGRKYFACYIEKGAGVPCAICLIGNYSGNLYHFIYEILSKWYIIQNLDIPNEIPLLVDASVREIPQFKDMMSIFSGRREIIYVEKLQCRDVAKLYYPSMVNMIPPNMKKMEFLISEDIVFDIKSIYFLRCSFLKEIEAMNYPVHPKIFISRKSTRWRKYNEDEIIDVVISKGFKVVYPELMTIREQFFLYSHVDYIIAASGAALSNIICCKPNTKVLVLISNRLDLTIYSTIAKSLDIDLTYLSGKITNYNNVQSDFIIDCDELRNVLNNE